MQGGIAKLRFSTSISLCFGDVARYWSKIAILQYPLAFDTPLWVSPLEYCHNVWRGNTRIG